MGKVTGFLEIERVEKTFKPVEERIKSFDEFTEKLDKKVVAEQGARCMDCGIPYCHTGCPVNNIIPDWNDLVYNDNWEEAINVLHSTNNFPEFTGRICPAPCEAACTLNLDDNPVAIKSIECAIVDNAWENGLIKPEPAQEKTGKSIAIIGSGPAGMAAAQQLVRAGHNVSLYEKNSKIGGLLRYGIPDFKMEKKLIDRRQEQLEKEGLIIKTNINVGVDITIKELQNKYDAVLLTGGAEVPRDLIIKGRDLEGVMFAMDFLPLQNRRVSGESLNQLKDINAKDKKVVVIGGGDTGSDCIGTSIRQGAKSVTQIEIMPVPPEKENKALTWPDWPLKMRVSSSQAEGAIRDFSVLTDSFYGEEGILKGLKCNKVDEKLKVIPNTEFQIEADLVLLAMGFTGPLIGNINNDNSFSLDNRGNISANTEDYKTSLKGIFSAGDMRRGQSLVVWAIREGRQAANSIDKYLMGETNLPR
jgi:glutamate synthase (NADPH/NADH) small chain|tara:strand:+ start:2497 stop:3915 length:1419 start_codon:yes stop_codon:yes gene_type:complete